jgi:hypothetical protein
MERVIVENPGKMIPALPKMRSRQDGENNNRAVLTWPIVRQIRADYQEEQNTVALAARYRISRPHVINIVSGRRWKLSTQYTECPAIW